MCHPCRKQTQPFPILGNALLARCTSQEENTVGVFCLILKVLVFLEYFSISREPCHIDRCPSLESDIQMAHELLHVVYIHSVRYVYEYRRLVTHPLRDRKQETDGRH